MKTKILIILCLLWFSVHLKAQTVTRAEAIAVAKKYIATLQTTTERTVDSVYCLDLHGKKILYEVHFSNGESVIISGNKKCKPILACQLESDVDKISVLDNYYELPDGLKDFINEYIEQIEYAYENRNVPHPDWNNMLNNSISLIDRNIIVPPITTTQWGQDEANVGNDPQAYNYYVSESGIGCTHCFAGCQPVAVAQIMRYWNYPVWHPNMPSQFDWCNMPEKLITSNSNYLKEKCAVAWLIRICGLIMDVTYCINGCETSTGTGTAPTAFRYFMYSCSDVKEKSSYNIDEWKTMLKSDLEEGMPVFYRGQSNTGGHAFVCDGYSSDDMFHFNWGWNGWYNNLWLTLDNLATYNGNYTSNQKAVFGIKPLNYDDFCGYAMLLHQYYTEYYNNYGGSNAPYEITPSVFFSLTSVPESTDYPASWRTIPSGASAEYVAHEEVVLLPGFTAEYGSDFEARIEKCEACESRMIQVAILEDNESEMTIDTSTGIRCFQYKDTTFVVEPSQFTIFPNPAEHTITLKGLSTYNNISILDIAGRIINNWSILTSDGNNTTLDIKRLSTSAYIVRIVTSDGKILIARFMKQ